MNSLRLFPVVALLTFISACRMATEGDAATKRETAGGVSVVAVQYVMWMCSLVIWLFMVSVTALVGFGEVFDNKILIILWPLSLVPLRNMSPECFCRFLISISRILIFSLCLCCLDLQFASSHGRRGMRNFAQDCSLSCQCLFGLLKA